MATFRMPLSGNVTQSILPWTWNFGAGTQLGLINIDLGQSSTPAVEESVLNEVGSYGKQLGRTLDALLVLLNPFEPAEGDEKAVEAFKGMAAEIKRVKARHGR